MIVVIWNRAVACTQSKQWRLFYGINCCYNWDWVHACESETSMQPCTGAIIFGCANTYIV